VLSERFEKAVSLQKAGKNEEALRGFEAISNEMSDEYDKSRVQLYEVTCLVSLGRFREARQCWSAAANYSPDSYTDLIDAYLCCDEGKHEEAFHKLTKLLDDQNGVLRKPENEGTYSEASERLGYLLFDAKRYAEAISRLTEALITPDSDERKKKISLYLGIAQLETGNLDDAEKRLVQSLPANCSDPIWTEAQFQLGRLYFQRGAYVKAKEAFERCELLAKAEDTELKQTAAQWLSATAARLKNPARERTN
jgi:tetratricopeptide (TPR) repeat protein